MESGAENGDYVKLEAEPTEAEVNCVTWLERCIFLGHASALVSEKGPSSL